MSNATFPISGYAVITFVSQNIFFNSLYGGLLHEDSSFDTTHHLVEFAQIASLLGTGFFLLRAAMEEVMMRGINFLNGNRFGDFKILLGTKIGDVLHFDPACTAITRNLAAFFSVKDDTFSKIVTTLGVATMGAANLIDEEGEAHSLLGLAVGSVGFALTTFDWHNNIGPLLVHTAMYTGALLLENGMRALVSTNITETDVIRRNGVSSVDTGLFSSNGVFVAKLFQILQGITLPLIPQLVVLTVTNDPMIDTKTRVSIAAATSVMAGLGKNIKEFYSVEGEEELYSGPNMFLVGAAGVLSLFIPLDSRPVGGVPAQTLYAFFTSLALLDSAASLGSVLLSFCFSNMDGYAGAVYEDFGTGSEEVAATDHIDNANPVDAY